MGNLISKSAFNECFKHWKYLMFSFFVVWNLNFLRRIHRHFWIKLIPKLGFKKSWEHMTHSMISWVSTNLMWPIPKNCSNLLMRNATCSVSFEWHLQRITLTSFHWKKNMFFIWLGGGFPHFVCGISQKKSVDLRFLGLNSSLLCFLQSPKWTVSFFSVSSHFTTAVFVFLSMLIICLRWIQCFPWFSTLTQSPA